MIGPNGAGKSTVFKAIFGLLRLREGTIIFKGRDVTGLSAARIAHRRHLLRAAGAQHFSRTVGNPQYQARCGRRAGREIADLPARIEAALDRFPALRKKAAQQASTLSGGEQKQLEIARGLLLNPQLVLIDEPSIGLSPLMVQQTFNILKELRDRGVSILMIEQNARSALEISDYGIVLELGQTRMVDKAARILGDLFLAAHRAVVPGRRDDGERRMKRAIDRHRLAQRLARRKAARGQPAPASMPSRFSRTICLSFNGSPARCRAALPRSRP